MERVEIGVGEALPPPPPPQQLPEESLGPSAEGEAGALSPARRGPLSNRDTLTHAADS